MPLQVLWMYSGDFDESAVHKNEEDSVVILGLWGQRTGGREEEEEVYGGLWQLYWFSRDIIHSGTFFVVHDVLITMLITKTRSQSVSLSAYGRAEWRLQDGGRKKRERQITGKNLINVYRTFVIPENTGTCYICLFQVLHATLSIVPHK